MHIKSVYQQVLNFFSNIIVFDCTQILCGVWPIRRTFRAVKVRLAFNHFIDNNEYINKLKLIG